MTTLPGNVEQLSGMIPRPVKDIGCQAIIQMSDVSRHGFLRKMPGSWGGRLFDTFLNRKWSSKFVVLRSGCMYIYSNETALNYERAGSLFGFQEVHQCGPEVYKAGKWVFQVVDALRDQEKDRSLFFSANSENDMKGWIESFQKEIMQGNLSILNSGPARASAKTRLLPALSEEQREVMRKSVTDADISITIKENEDTDSDGSDYLEVDEEANKSSDSGDPVLKLPPRPLPNTPDLPEPKPRTAADVRPKPEVKSKFDFKPKPNQRNDDSTLEHVLPVAPKPKPKPQPTLPSDSEAKKGLQAKVSLPQLQSTLLKPPKPDDSPLPTKPVEEAKQKKLQPPPKPTSHVKPMLSTANPPLKAPAKPLTSSSSSASDLRGRQVPQPPPFNPAAAFSSFGAYEGGFLNDDTEYELWDEEDNSMSDPLVKAAYWTKDSDQAAKVMVSIAQDGVFLIRDAADGNDYKTLMVYMVETESNIRKYKIVKENTNLYSLHLGQSGFKSLQELIKYYQKNSLPNRNTKLTKPYTEVWKPN